ncbi:MAG: fused MFS/spermidine synthase [Longimicrobiales bacterium]
MGKQLLPLLGGAPAVWNVCLLFFQSSLLAGYAFAHGITRVRSMRAQLVLLFAVVAVSCATLPVAFATTPASSSHPSWWLIGHLTLQIGLPFFALAAATPLFQHWYGQAANERDPYVLYAASNTGSLIALLAYPILLEPRWAIAQQNRAWAVAFGGVLLLLLGIGMLLRRATPQAESAEPSAAPIPWRTQLRWIGLSFAPSSMLLGVTSYLTTDLASVPLLWIIPLALYLTTFIVAFGVARAGPPVLLLRTAVILAVTWVVVYRLQPTEPLWLLIVAHLAFFVCTTLVCHTRLAAQRPARQHLTRFYLLIAVGGALGGAFNALIAPVLFEGFWEYPLIALFALLLALPDSPIRLRVKRDLAPAVGVLALALFFLSLDVFRSNRSLAALVCVGVPATLAFVLSREPLRFVLALTALVLTLPADRSLSGRVVQAQRNFFGVLRITTDARGRFHELRHGNTLHGAADMAQPEGSRPLTYYSYRSPGIEVLRTVQERSAHPAVGVVGLGVGTLAWYARANERWTFFEINPAVIGMAQDPELFGFLQRSRAGSIEIRAGDARIELRHVPDSSFNLLVLDAFSSDAIPLHLLTREAVQLYTSKLSARGLLAFHISNRYLDLAPVLAEVTASLGLRIRARGDLQPGAADRAQRIEPSHWVAVARNDADFGETLFTGTWYIPRGRGRPAWTDDYSNVWSALLW